jgi:hypothetical protein
MCSTVYLGNTVYQKSVNFSNTGSQFSQIWQQYIFYLLLLVLLRALNRQSVGTESICRFLKEFLIKWFCKCI